MTTRKAGEYSTMPIPVGDPDLSGPGLRPVRAPAPRAGDVLVEITPGQASAIERELERLGFDFSAVGRRYIHVTDGGLRIDELRAVTGVLSAGMEGRRRVSLPHNTAPRARRSWLL